MASQIASTLLTPIVQGVASAAFNPTNPNQNRHPAGASSTVRSPPPRKPFHNQQNPVPIEFGDPENPIETVFLDSPSTPASDITSAFHRLNPNTTSVAGGGVSPTFADSIIQSMRKDKYFETFLRRSCIEAVMSMKRLNLPKPPVAMSALLARGKSAAAGWQIWIHSSIKNSGPLAGGQARLAPVLEQRLREAKYQHHFSSMCAEMALLTNYLSEYDPMERENLFDQQGKLRPWGEKVYMMTYNTSVMPSGTDGTGRYFNPCSHTKEACGERDANHRGNIGCKDVLALLDVQVVGKGKPSEQDVRILVELGELPPSALNMFRPRAQQAGGSSQANPRGGQSQGSIPPIVAGERPPEQPLDGEDPPVQLKTNQRDAVKSGVPFAPGYPKTKAKKADGASTPSNQAPKS